MREWRRHGLRLGAKCRPKRRGVNPALVWPTTAPDVKGPGTCAPESAGRVRSQAAGGSVGLPRRPDVIGLLNQSLDPILNATMFPHKQPSDDQQEYPVSNNS